MKRENVAPAWRLGPTEEKRRKEEREDERDVGASRPLVGSVGAACEGSGETGIGAVCRWCSKEISVPQQQPLEAMQSSYNGIVITDRKVSGNEQGVGDYGSLIFEIRRAKILSAAQSSEPTKTAQDLVR